MLKQVVGGLPLRAVHPHQRHNLVGVLTVGRQCVVVRVGARRAKNGLLDIVFRHLLKQPLGVEIDIERTAERSNVRVCVNLFEFTEIVHL